MVLTLVFGIFLGKKTGLPTWIGGIFTFSGMFFLSAAGRLDAINPGDLITAVSAVSRFPMGVLAAAHPLLPPP
jgi:drug/metabolite transporter (DMT)-like permease